MASELQKRFSLLSLIYISIALQIFKTTSESAIIFYLTLKRNLETQEEK